MSLEVHIEWQGHPQLVARLHAAERGASVSFEYAIEWLQRADAFSIHPTSLASAFVHPIMDEARRLCGS